MNQVEPKLKFNCERTSWNWGFEMEFSLDLKWFVANRKRVCGRGIGCSIGEDSPQVMSIGSPCIETPR